ncbi:hypothetical protein [Brevundimonas sp.]|uniref:hypothetical protein n=1 Tax=Brevundimonas sp. TaxID=1871086 RepID=UPI0035AF03DB
MTGYQLRCVGADDRWRLPSIEAADDADAMRRALGTLRQQDCRAVEVWQGSRLVARVGRQPGDRAPAGTALHGAR